LNPFNYNPLKKLIEESVDFERVRTQDAIKLFLSATNVRTAKVKVFSGKELRSEHVLASTCLPLLMQAVEVDGEHYWDGGYAGNPAIFPVVYECESPDVVLVHLTPADRPDVPTSSPAIMNRMQEISFNTALIREMRSVAVRNRRVEEGIMPGGKRTFELQHRAHSRDAFGRCAQPPRRRRHHARRQADLRPPDRGRGHHSRLHGLEPAERGLEVPDQIVPGRP
jgi:predicted acylesterase/phospholipase RssA